MTEVILRDVPSFENITDYTLPAHLLEVNHNVNFKGEIVVEKSKF